MQASELFSLFAGGKLENGPETWTILILEAEYDPDERHGASLASHLVLKAEWIMECTKLKSSQLLPDYIDFWNEKLSLPRLGEARSAKGYKAHVLLSDAAAFEYAKNAIVSLGMELVEDPVDADVEFIDFFTESDVKANMRTISCLVRDWQTSKSQTACLQ